MASSPNLDSEDSAHSDQRLPRGSPGPTRGQPRPDVRLIAGDRWNRSFPEWNKSAIFELNLFLNAIPVVGFFSGKSKVAGSLFGFF